MSIVLTQIPDALETAPQTAAKQAPVVDTAPPGYRWVSQRWRVLPGGRRDYAAYHGLTEFRTLRPVSSRLRSGTHT